MTTKTRPVRQVAENEDYPLTPVPLNKRRSLGTHSSDFHGYYDHLG
ncbi:MAG: hypothetical protein HC824_13335 [Synechococcales cyanobacterium RM1_1_8]|nr:hypothetical protein [Synechococcales cyanobacterium RM1_1_8]